MTNIKSLDKSQLAQSPYSTDATSLGFYQCFKHIAMHAHAFNIQPVYVKTYIMFIYEFVCALSIMVCMIALIRTAPVKENLGQFT